jgi:hypothetical protein
MADMKVRNLDERVAQAETIVLTQEAFARRAATCRAATSGRGRRRPSDSVAIIRRERDAWG